MNDDLDVLAARLLALDRSGRGPEWTTFYERACPRLVAWMALHLHGALRQRIDPGDLAQETWARALTSLDSFDSERGTFLQWLHGIARNVLRGALQTMAARREESGGTSHARRLEAHAEEITGITRRAASNDTLSAFIQHLREHDPDDQMLVITCALEREPIAEAARRLGISEDAATKRWQRLRARLASSAAAQRLLAD
ncbi:MAG: sigma-70 family RNA polymerase sigma factor [Planctomycetes bacterium]|nr:sigma-70 family RNA polymerase sigma factor [Planctomycetota bacterium]